MKRRIMVTSGHRHSRGPGRGNAPEGIERSMNDHVTTAPSPIVPTIDLEADGVRHGHLRLPHSRDDSAWGAVMIPLTVVRNGKGPTALLTGANHGDEYEGVIALFELARCLDPAAVNGRVIIVPAMNYPAFRAGTRTSPIDRGNLNRSFPGRPDGTVTGKIADYFQRCLLPLADVVLDIHSGGKTLEFVPFAASHILADKGQEARCAAAAAAFGAPYTMRMLEIDNVGMYDTAAEHLGKVFVSTELGGGGTTTARTVAVARRGVRNLLTHAGILAIRAERSPTVRLDMPSGDCFVISEDAGLIEPCIDLGETVRAGDVVARIHPVERTGAAPREYSARLDGILAGRHFPGLVQLGDCIAVIGTAMREG
jgi:N-alpha-acetyl-L-2,4-diaminobutyrate deacetylase